MDENPWLVAEIKKQFPSDIVLWMGQPDPLRFWVQTLQNMLRIRIPNYRDFLQWLPLLIIGAIFFTLFPEIGRRSSAGSNSTRYFLFAVSVVVVLFLLEIYVKGVRTTYAMTNKHLVIYEQPMLIWKTNIIYYKPSEFAQIVSSASSDGKGSLTLTTKSGKENVKLWGIAHVKTVEEAIRSQFEIIPGHGDAQTWHY